MEPAGFPAGSRTRLETVSDDNFGTSVVVGAEARLEYDLDATDPGAKSRPGAVTFRTCPARGSNGTERRSP